jgi:hypothetical protein
MPMSDSSAVISTTSSRWRKPSAVGPIRLQVTARCAPSGGPGAHDLEEGLVGAEVLLALVAGQLQRDHRHRQAHGLGHAAGIVLDQLGGAGGADDHRLRLEALIGILAGGP